MQLFCFTCAGGTAAFYDRLDPYINPSVELVKLEYAGHGNRIKENKYPDFDQLADDMYDRMLSVYNQNDYALMGYSMGTITVIEVLKRIYGRGELQLPKHVFLAAHEPHPKKELEDFSDTVSDECIKKTSIAFGGIDDKLINSSIFWRVYLPLYRADYELIWKYDFNRIIFCTEIPATFFYSPADTPAENIRLWKNYFKGKTEFVEYEGSHFFINEKAEEMCSVINNKLISEGSNNDI